jgi:hypothetical protein
MELSDLLLRVTRAFEELNVPYLVTGSLATIAYGEPRLTMEVDIVVRLSARAVDRLCSAFPEDEFYVSPEAVRDAVRRSSQFDILHPRSGLKVDVMVTDDSDFNASRFSRSRTLAISPSDEAVFASPEDVILKKLEYYREGGSDKHLRDIAGVLRIMSGELDLGYLDTWARRLGVDGLWAEVRRKTQQG